MPGWWLAGALASLDGATAGYDPDHVRLFVPPGSPELDYTWDCSQLNWLFEAISPSYVVAADSAYNCQLRCAQDAACDRWSFTMLDHKCHMAGPNSKAKFSLNTITQSKAGLQGCACPSPEASKWPPLDSTDMFTAYGDRGQPLGLQCWPKNSQFQMVKCGKPKVLQDTASGWSGRCLGLSKIALVPGVTCEMSCVDTPSCSTWQEIDEDILASGIYAGCYQGTGYDCQRGDSSLPAGWKPKAAQRLQHGYINVVATITNYQIQYMTNAFDSTAYSTEEDGIKNCREVCYANIYCEYWQYYTSSGCWLHSPQNVDNIHYPLTASDSILTAVSSSSDLVAGEYIQHFCGQPTSQDATTHSLPSAPPWLPVAGMAGILCIVGLCAVCMPSSRSGVSRGLKRETALVPTQTAEIPMARPIYSPLGAVPTTVVRPASYQMVPTAQSMTLQPMNYHPLALQTFQGGQPVPMQTAQQPAQQAVPLNQSYEVPRHRPGEF